MSAVAIDPVSMRIVTFPPADRFLVSLSLERHSMSPIGGFPPLPLFCYHMPNTLLEG